MTALAPKIRRALRKTACTPAKLLLNRLAPPVIVLLYHRVAALAVDPEMLAVSPENFRLQLRHLKESVPLVGFADDWSRLSAPAVAITFDDGYADNARQALPILEELGVPATFFVSTGTIGTGTEFWWHEVERIILEKPDLPPRFTLADDTRGNGWPTESPLERQACYREIVRLMNDADAERRRLWLSQLRRWAHSAEAADDAHRVMTVDELRLLAASPLVTIGAHTVTHSRLASLPREVQRAEIASSKVQLEGWLDREITAFSYPFGRRSDYTRETTELCRQAGFAKAAANFPGQAHRWTDPFQIPRHLVRDWPAETFAQKLRGFWTR